MTPENVEEAAAFAPPSCAYRLLLQGEQLPFWHHLNTGSSETVHQQGQSVRHRVRFEREVNEEEMQEYIVEWPGQ